MTMGNNRDDEGGKRSPAREANVKRIRDKLSKDDDHGPISLNDGGRFYFENQPQSPEQVKKSWDEEAKQPNLDPHSITAPFTQGKAAPPPIKPTEAQALPQEQHGDLLASILAGLAHVGGRVQR